MAVMQKCCCCGVRAGTIASAIYSMVIAILGIANFGYGLLYLPTYKELLYEMQAQDPAFDGLDIDSYVKALKADYIIACAYLFLLLISSVWAIVAINKDSKEMLVPFLVSKMLGFMWYAFVAIMAGYYVSQFGKEMVAAAGIALIIVLICLVPFFVCDIICFLCVLSQYQEYRDGRGRQCDQIVTTMIVQQPTPAATGGFSYGHMEDDAPPAYGPPTATKSNSILME